MQVPFFYVYLSDSVALDGDWRWGWVGFCVSLICLNILAIYLYQLSSGFRKLNFTVCKIANSYVHALC